jgi:hypothetical protein
VAPLSSSATSSAVPHMDEKIKGTFIELFSLMYMMREANARTQAR